MSDERVRVVHPSWCDREACTAPEFLPTGEEFQAAGTRGHGQHRSRELVADKYRPGGGVIVYLSQEIAPWVCATYLNFQLTEGEYPDVVSTQVGEAGAGFALFELLGQEVKDAVRKWPRLYAERFPDVQRATEAEADEATADAVMPRDPVELEEQMTAEFLADEDDTTGSANKAPETQDVEVSMSSYRVTVNAKELTEGTLPEAKAAVADLVTRRLAAAPERLAGEAQTINRAFSAGAVEADVEERGQWFTVFDAYGEDPLRIMLTKEE